MKKGFTLMELIVVVIIIGILAMIGLPQFFRVAERGRAAEGVAALGALRSSQLRYAAEHGTTTDAVANLDMQALNMRYFGTVVVTGALDPNDVANAATDIASVTRNDTDNSNFGTYTLAIAINGTINCSGSVAANDICPVLGYAAPAE